MFFELYSQNIKVIKKKYILYFFTAFAFSFVFVILLFNFINEAPRNFPVATDITIEDGMTLNEITKLLGEVNVIRSPLYFYFLVSHSFKNAYIQAGTYSFPIPLTSKDVADKITSGRNTKPLLKVTFPEGFKAKNLHSFLPETYSNIPTESFSQYEGYLFPDTYFISKDMPFQELVKLMQVTFIEKIEPLIPQIESSKFTLDEVVILASIIEREAKDLESKKMVSGILQNRLAKNMPLQVDASLDFILDKTSEELTLDDLSVDSPYNSYINRGLPPTPIANPGLESLMAVLEPINSDNIYYLTGNDGMFYYAKTFEEHKKNKKRYLE
ncbi:MAG: endolytic transglycosylase MltG [Candidatus Pacebacteria bacterium]|nr:endolytic transglycosylase MltG [Candidatus Paceibacterota bacterium]MCF7857053.1 endolytic transglycosylase MltG [Candidatus Paceibacterota bacterium]